MTEAWPDIPFEPWKDTCATFHRWVQIVGKYRLARTPWVNHSWHATLYVTSRGLTTSLIPAGDRGVQFDFDLIDHSPDRHRQRRRDGILCAGADDRRRVP